MLEMACDVIDTILRKPQAILRLEKGITMSSEIIIIGVRYDGVCLFGKTEVWTSRGFAARCLNLT